LLKSQIQRIVVTRGARVLADVGTGAALAPVHGVIRNGSGATVGRYTMSVGRDSGIARLIHALTGAQVVMRAAGRPVVSTLPAAGHALPAARTAGVAGARSSISSFDGAAFPSGRLRVSLLFGPVDPGLCGATRAATVANTIGGIGERLLSDERGGAATARVLRIVASDPRFVRAVATNDASAVRRRIIRFFRDHTLHVVRVRAVAANGSVVNDVGGPFVIAPASAGLRSNGRTIGRVMLSIQDDTGYIKLMRRFTRADVLLRTPAGQVPGSALSPGPSHLPRRGTVTYRGRTYQVFSFAAQAFPSGPLRISLLVPQAAGSA
jgi:hypothetical protein